jgi:two-component system LytT family response regulator
VKTDTTPIRINSFLKNKYIPMTLLNTFLIEDNVKIIQSFENFGMENSSIFSIVGKAKSLRDGLKDISIIKPNLIIISATKENYKVFETLSNIDFLEAKFIFIGSNEKEAYQAFKCNAVDFMLKPINFDAFSESLSKVMHHFERELAYLQVLNGANNDWLTNSTKDFFIVSSLDKIEIIKFVEVLYCKADGKYTEFFLQNGDKVLSSKNIGEYQNIFPKASFFRIHNSCLVNVHQILRINKKDGLYCEFKNGVDLPVAKRKEKEFLKYLRVN